MFFPFSRIRIPGRITLRLFLGILLFAVFSSCDTRSESTRIPIPATPTFTATTQPELRALQPPSTSGEPVLQVTPTQTPSIRRHKTGVSRGYLTTPEELAVIAQKASRGIEPYNTAVNDVMQWADKEWNYKLKAHEDCPSSDRPRWNDNGAGTPVLYGKALAYHLTGNPQYAEEVKDILESIMTQVLTIDVETEQCRLAFGWGTPELVASADLIEDYWWNQTCTGPTSTLYKNTEIGTGNCKKLFQNWLVKNPYYIVSYSAVSSKSNWGAAATNATAYIADYLWDRPDVSLIHRNPPEVNGGKDIKLSPSQAYKFANQLALDRMNGYGVELRSSSSCDYLSGSQQNGQWPPVKSQITEKGIIPEDARRQEYCNITAYNGQYQNYPQIHIGHNIQQCELMLRRGDASCYNNVDNTDLRNYKFRGPDGLPKTTHLYPGRGSIERAIKAIIVDSNTEWRHNSALEVAVRYYYNHHTLPGYEQWAPHLSDKLNTCSQDICFGTLTHGFSIGNETPDSPPIVSPP